MYRFGMLTVAVLFSLQQAACRPSAPSPREVELQQTVEALSVALAENEQSAESTQVHVQATLDQLGAERATEALVRSTQGSAVSTEIIRGVEATQEAVRQTAGAHLPTGSVIGPRRGSGGGCPSVSSGGYSCGILDGGENAGWTSGNGDVAGAWIDIELSQDRDQTVTGLRVWLAAGDTTCIHNVKEATLIFSDNTVQQIAFDKPESSGWQYRPIVPTATKVIRLYVDSTFPPTGDACGALRDAVEIREIQVYGE